MDPPPNQQAAQVNLTRALEALSPYINNPRRMVVRIEAFVIAAVVLMFVQLFLGRVRRQCGHWSVHGVLWLAYTASFPLITYALGQMVSSPVKNALYPLWAVFLFSAAGCTHSIIAYDLQDSKSWKRHLFELIQYLVYLVIISRLLTPASNSTPFKPVNNRHGQPIQNAIGLLLFMLVYANVVRLIAGWMVTNSAPSKFVANYMREQVAAIKGNQQESFNPVTMKGYKYLVYWSPRRKIKPRSFSWEQVDVSSSYDPITIEQIWRMDIDGPLFNSNKGDSSKSSNKGGLGVKDLCLSFALSHLLKRRYFEMECVEASRQETRDFFLKGLLSEEEEANGYKRAFQIIEVELSFLYDFFFTKYAALFHMEVSYLIIFVIKLISIAICGVVLLMNSPTIKTLDPVIEVGTRRVDVIITIAIMASFLAVEVVQFVLYVTSEWATVSLACSCTKYSNSKCIMSLIRLFGRFKVILRRFKVIGLHGYWQNKMGQSSVVSHSMPPYHFLQTGDLLLDVMFHSQLYLCWSFTMIFSGNSFIKVPDLVKREIVSWLKEHDHEADGPLIKGRRALHHHGLDEEFSRTLENRSYTSIMVVWHIATEHCDDCLKKEKKLDNQQVATTLSRYCAYLISSASDLLPGNSTVTLFSIGPNRGPRELTTKDDDIYKQGKELGKLLLEKIEDENDRWSMLAEFWVDTIIYIATSDNAKAHMERLAQGGEFLTHVWALVTHSGILQRGKKETDTAEDIPDTDTPEDIRPDSNV